MKNKEKYDLREFSVASCNGIVKLFNGEGTKFKEFKGYSSFIEWLETEYKEPIQLTEAERVILENIDIKWKWIARDKNGNLYLYDNEKPIKSITAYCCVEVGDTYKFTLYNHLFKFIKWEDEEPYNIQELLERYKQEA